MMILVKTDNHVTGSADRAAEVQAEVEEALARFADRITRVEVKYFDDNSREKSSEIDLRCVIEVRLSGLDPLVVSHQAGNLQQATEGALDKIKKSIDRTLGRLNNHKGRTSFSGDETVETPL